MTRTASALVGATVLLVGVSTVSAAQHASGARPPHAPTTQAPAHAPVPQAPAAHVAPPAAQEHHTPAVDAGKGVAGNHEQAAAAPAATSQHAQGSAAHSTRKAASGNHGSSHSTAPPKGAPVPTPHTP